MGLVVNQSIKNTISTYLGFGLGALNTLFFYTHYISSSQYGLVSIVLSSATLLMPLIGFGIPNTLIKFFPTYNENSQRELLGFGVFTTLVLSLLTAFILGTFENEITYLITDGEGANLPSLWYVFWIGVSMAFFELGYAMSKVYFQTVFGNFTKEIPHRILISLSLFGLHQVWFDFEQFLMLLVAVYFFRTLLMLYYVIKVCKVRISFRFRFPISPLLSYSVYLLLGTTAALIVLELDKVMINQFLQLEDVAYYTVAVFIATVIAVPMRSMHQITMPITSKIMAENQKESLISLYKNSSLHLLVGAGFILLLILVNLSEIYTFIPRSYESGMWVVAILGLSKLFDASLGINNAILYNSSQYKMVLVTGIFLAIATVLFNWWFIPRMGIIGAAWASLLAMSVYNLIKLILVYRLYNSLPYTKKSFWVLLFLGVLYTLNTFLPSMENPYVSMAFKTLFFGVIYSLVLYRFKLSKEFNLLIQRLFKLKS